MSRFRLKNNSKLTTMNREPATYNLLKTENFILNPYNFLQANAVNIKVCTFYAP
jgi:hypothetical protein